MAVEWTPAPDATFLFRPNLVELHPDEQDPAKRNRWRAPSPVGFTVPERRADQLEFDGVYKWTLPEAQGATIRFMRQAEAMQTRLVVRDNWTCEKTPNVIVTQELYVRGTEHPNMTLTLLEATPGAYAQSGPLLDLLDKKPNRFINLPVARGIVLGDLNGGSLTVKFDFAAFIEIRLETSQTSKALRQVLIRFRTPLPDRLPLESGGMVMVADWTPAAATPAP